MVFAPGALGKVLCPTLTMHGAEDAYTPLFQAEYLKHHVTGNQLHVMEKERHMLHLKHHEEFNEKVEHFLNTQTS